MNNAGATSGFVAIPTKVPEGSRKTFNKDYIAALFELNQILYTYPERGPRDMLKLALCSSKPHIIHN